MLVRTGGLITPGLIFETDTLELYWRGDTVFTCNMRIPSFLSPSLSWMEGVLPSLTHLIVSIRHQICFSVPYICCAKSSSSGFKTTQTRRKKKTVQSPCYALGVLLYWTTWNSSYLWGNAFVFSLLRERKGTVCRAGLDTRVQSKCLVAELLSWEQKVAHIVVVSFPLHQIKTFFFFLLWEAGPAAPEPMQAGENETSAAASKKQNKTKKKESGVSVLDVLKHQQQQTERNLVFLWWATNKAEW